MMSGAPVFEMEGDVEVADDASLALLKTMEVFQYDNPKNKDFNSLLARSYGTYCMGFLEYDILRYKNKDEELYNKYLQRIKLFYSRGKEYGLNALKKNGSFKRALTKDLGSFEKALKGMGRRYVPRLFWTAMNWGNLINLSKTSPLAVAQFPKVEAIMQRVIQLDPNYYYAVPHVYFGVSYSTRTSLFGGNLGKSKAHFEKALAAYNRKFLMTHVYYAQFYAVRSGDKELYKSLLNEVLISDAKALPEARLANELAKIRAEWLLKHQKEVFNQ